MASTPKLNKRMKGVVLEKKIITGSIAFWLGKKAFENQSHKWWIYVRGVEKEDISYYVKKVVFGLHPSCEEPTRIVESYPFQIQSYGWGEFDISIKIHFVDPSERAVELIHGLKLYPANQTPNTKRPVVNEIYDEIVFSEPTENFHRILSSSSSMHQGSKEEGEEEKMMDTEEEKKEITGGASEEGESMKEESSLQPKGGFSQYYNTFSDTPQIKQLEDAYHFIKQEVEQHREIISSLDDDIRNLRAKIKEMEN